MSAQKGYYSIVQYCPDAGRAEAANVGVILFCPGIPRIRVRMATGTRRVQRFFGKANRYLINAAKDAIVARLEVEEDRFRTIEDLQKYIDTCANEITITDPRPIKVLDFDTDLDNLFRDLVGGRPAQSGPVGEPEVPELDALLIGPRFEGRLHRNYTCEIPVLGRPFRVPYAYKNGNMNLIKPQRFSSLEGPAISTASRLAVDDELLRKHTGDRIIVVSRFEEPRPEAGDKVVRLFEDLGVTCVTLDGLPAFADRGRS